MPPMPPAPEKRAAPREHAQGEARRRAYRPARLAQLTRPRLTSRARAPRQPPHRSDAQQDSPPTTRAAIAAYRSSRLERDRRLDKPRQHPRPSATVRDRPRRSATVRDGPRRSATVRDSTSFVEMAQPDRSRSRSRSRVDACPAALRAEPCPHPHASRHRPGAPRAHPGAAVRRGERTVLQPLTRRGLPAAPRAVARLRSQPRRDRLAAELARARSLPGLSESQTRVGDVPPASPACARS